MIKKMFHNCIEIVSFYIILFFFLGALMELEHYNNYKYIIPKKFKKSRNLFILPLRNNWSKVNKPQAIYK